MVNPLPVAQNISIDDDNDEPGTTTNLCWENPFGLRSV